MSNLELRIVSQVIGVFPHNQKHVVTLKAGIGLAEGKCLTCEFSTCWHPARVQYTLKGKVRNGSWITIASYENGAEYKHVVPFIKHPLLSILALL